VLVTVMHFAPRCCMFVGVGQVLSAVNSGAAEDVGTLEDVSPTFPRSCVANVFQIVTSMVTETAAMIVLGFFQLRVFCFSGIFFSFFEQCES
jgi:hypothetical protein